MESYPVWSVGVHETRKGLDGYKYPNSLNRDLLLLRYAEGIE